MFIRTRRVLLLSLWLCAAGTQGARGQGLRPLPHPNHYIILVDAAVPNARAEARRQLYEATLFEHLAQPLYRDGFAPAIPPYDPQQDYLTLQHFGVVTGDATTAYTRLAGHDLLTDFVHPIISREKGVEAGRLRERLRPSQTYQYTLLTWAKQLALHRSSPRDPNEPVHRTFIIMVHDGRPNEHSVMAEMEMVRRWSGDRYQTYARLVESVDLNYRFTDGRGKEGMAWSASFGDQPAGGGQQFFIEAYEVVSGARAGWEAQASGLRPLKDLKMRWVADSGDPPRGTLTATLSEEFNAWARSADDSEVSLAAGDEGELGSSPGLEVPVTLRGALTCQPPTFGTALRATLRRTDPLLGSRTVIYTHRQAVTGPQTLYCTRAFTAAAAALATVGALMLVGFAYVVYYRRRATHFELLIPGLRAPLRVPRAGRRPGSVMVVPQEGLEALSLRLPGRFKQWLLYRGAEVTLLDQAGECPLRWLGRDGPSRLRLPLEAGLVPAYWNRPPRDSSTITFNLRQGRKSADVALTYPRALAESTTRSLTNMQENGVYVALDLGSESMAAYFEDTHDNRGMIKLQAPEKLLRADGSQQFELLTENGDGGLVKTSPRLWNRISFKDEAQPPEPGNDHATLRFFLPANGDSGGQKVSLEDYRRSLFNYFHTQGGWPPPYRVMPNPKILFQQQVTNVLSSLRVVAKDKGGLVRLHPEMLIKHLTLQVINNFLLSSPELSRYDRRDINLTITIPNVYSLPHAESIKEFVRQNIPDLAGVEVLSESDAVTFYTLKAVDKERDHPDLIRFKRAWIRELRQSGAVCFVTIDVGKGTTDLSCILVQEPPPKSPGLLGRLLGRAEGEEPHARHRRHSVQGKTGKASGGTYLNYIFACYYDRRLAEVISRVPEGALPRPPFGLVRQTPFERLREEQVKAAAALEALVDSVKRNMTEDYAIDESRLSMEDQRKLAENVVDHILTGIDLNWKELSPGEKEPYLKFQAEAVEALLLPPRLVEPEPRRGRSLFGLRLKGGPETEGPAPQTAGPRPSPQTAQLRRAIEGYVAENVDELLESLSNLVADHQSLSDDRRGIDGTSFVIVSGQGSQFKPLRAAIRGQCQKLGIVDDEHILMLSGTDSKEACCKGVVNFWRNKMETVNPKELHGTYGCMDFLSGEFRAFDMRDLNAKGAATIRYDTASTYFVVFTPRSSRETEERPPELNDGATARIGFLSEGSEFTLRYDPDRLELTINGGHLTIGNFGSADSSIYKKVWPELLEPHQD